MDTYNKSVQHNWFHHATWGSSKYKSEGVGKVLWHSLTESGEVEIVNIQFGKKVYEGVSVKHLNPVKIQEHSHAPKRSGKELDDKKKKKKVKEGMIKLKKLVKESFGDRKFGEPLPTFSGVMKDHQLGKVYTDKDRPPFQVKEETINENDLQRATRIYNDFEQVIGKFGKDIARITKDVEKLKGDKTDSKIFIKQYVKGINPLLAMIRSWFKGEQRRPR